jgi:RNA polymerase sigma factor (sigma-70 family)
MIEKDVALASSGDKDAYARLVERHRRLVSSIALAHVRDASSSDDVAQEVFVQAWSGLPKLRSASSFLPWLRQLTRNVALHHVRDRTRAPEPVTDELIDQVADPRASDADAMITSERQRALEAALDALPDDARELVVLYYREGRSTAQVAELLGISEEAARQRLSRARAKIRDDVFARLGEGEQGDDQFVRGVLVAIGKAGILGPFAFAVAVGLAGTWTGLRPYLRAALTADERSAVVRIGVLTSVSAVVFAVAGPAAVLATGALWPGVALFAVFAGACGFLYKWKLARVIAPRLARERHEDPTAARRQRRAAIRGWAGFAIAIAIGFATFAWIGYGARIPFAP